jgi:hypothetical protein
MKARNAMWRSLPFQFALFVGSCLSCRPLGFAASNDQYWDDRFGSPGANGEIYAMAVRGNEVYVGGYFSTVGGVQATNVARWDGTTWSGLGSGLGNYSGIRSEFGVGSIEVMGKEIYAAGGFTNAGAERLSNIARWDGTNWLAVGNGTDAAVFTLKAIGTNLYAAGAFTNAGNRPANHVAKWDGTKWSALGNGVSYVAVGYIGKQDFGYIWALGSDETNLYAGGFFTNAGGLYANSIAKWDGENWHSLGFGKSQVYSIAVRSSELYVGGIFPWTGGQAGTAIAKWDGTGWTALGGAVTSGTFLPSVYALRFVGNDLYAAGTFTQIGGVNAANIARWDGTSWNALGTGVNASTGVLALTSTDGELYAGGSLNSAGNKPSTNIALWHIPQTLQITRTADKLAISWPVTGTNSALEATDAPGGTNWERVPAPFSIQDGRLTVIEDISSRQRYYRLRGK